MNKYKQTMSLWCKHCMPHTTVCVCVWILNTHERTAFATITTCYSCFGVSVFHSPFDAHAYIAAALHASMRMCCMRVYECKHIQENGILRRKIADTLHYIDIRLTSVPIYPNFALQRKWISWTLEKCTCQLKNTRQKLKIFHWIGLLFIRVDLANCFFLLENTVSSIIFSSLCNLSQLLLGKIHKKSILKTLSLEMYILCSIWSMYKQFSPPISGYKIDMKYFGWQKKLFLWNIVVKIVSSAFILIRD